MIVKYKVSDFAKDLNLSAKKVLDELAAMGSTGKKNSSNLEENELNYLLEKFSKDNSVANLDEFLNSAKAPKEEPKAEKKAEQKVEKKAEKKPEAPKADKKPQQPAAKAEQPKANNNNNNGKHGDKKPEQHKKREEKTVSFSELARETGAKATAAPAQAVSVRREDNQVTVDTRTVDMNVDRFDARYDDLASTKNTENRRKPTPQGNKQKFTQRGQRQRQQFQKGKRETEFERLQRIQLEKARNAQLKVLIPDEITVGELAARLNVGRGTIREAVKLLVARNCLEIRRGKGTFVVEKPGQIEDPLGFAYVKDKITLAVDLMELRLQLEPWVAQLAAQRIEENEKDTLRQLCEQVEHKIRSGEDHGPADKEFHAYVARCTHNSVITEIMPVITYSIEMFTKFKAPRLLEDTIRTHWQTMEAICANDPQKAYDSMYEHVSENRESIEIVRRMSMEQNRNRDN